MDSKYKLYIEYKKYIKYIKYTEYIQYISYTEYKRGFHRGDPFDPPGYRLPRWPARWIFRAG